MAVPLESRNSRKLTTKPSHQCQKKKTIQKDDEKPQPPWGTLRSFFSCKYHQTVVTEGGKKRLTRIGWSGALCNLRESSKVMQRPEPNSPESSKDGGSGIANSISSRSLKAPSSDMSGALTTTSSSSLSHSSASIAAATSSSSSSSLGGSFSGMHLRRFSGCYECHTVVDPVTGVSRVPSMRRNSVFTCSDCGEIFTKSETLELHQALKHAVSELCPEDNSRNIIEIIFQSSWLKKEAPVCKIDRILKVHNTQKTISRFEAYRDSIKSSANSFAKKHARCIADGNELLRFHCTSISCSLGLNGSTNLCVSSPGCSVCSIVRDGFKPDALGKIRTMETSGGAHDVAEISSDGEERAMLVCRVIGGRVNKNQDGSEDYDSVAGSTGTYSNLDELLVFDPKAILPCFVVIYRGF
ncbi:uncharacterized protein M6B38_377805 [Iris pallida]|uniref:C2H2-type domain-containing protein n=1 Tax=Iris pallida TaxID=29817 RepID=A0AAX6GBF1_IRIPA|nr:uncharacterized protein M6B38_377805 [Iris pallida]